MHHIDRSCPWDEIWEAMETLIRQGKIVYVGSSNFEAWEGLCMKLGYDCAAVALGWLLSNDVVTAPIIGPRTIEQLDQSIAALAVSLDVETLSKLDEIFPGPGGEAPQAYAW